jgi:hypothetical protein
MSRTNLLTIFFALPLIFATLGESGSCRQNKASNTPNRASSTTNKVSNMQKDQNNKASTGLWGGVHVQMQVTESGAEIEYDCAHGTISQPIELDSEGRFDVKGSYVSERGGPVRRDAEPRNRPARYTGTINGKTMTLTVTLIDKEQSMGTYTLAQGDAGRIRKCQ